MMVTCISGITVNAQKLKIEVAQKTIYVKQNLKLTIVPEIFKTKVKWKSANKKIATVSKKSALFIVGS
jgi:hypothetical protein